MSNKKMIKDLKYNERLRADVLLASTLLDNEKLYAVPSDGGRTGLIRIKYADVKEFKESMETLEEPYVYLTSSRLKSYDELDLIIKCHVIY